MKKLLSAIAILLLPGLLFAQNMQSHYKVYHTKSKIVVGLDTILEELKSADVLFFGEEHNDSIGHFLEFKLFEKMAPVFNNNIALTMEMFHTDVQPVIDEYINGNISERNFIKEGRAWNNYKDYRPMIELAKSKKLAVVGGNSAARYSNSVTVNGLTSLEKFPKTSQQFFAPLPIDTATGRYQEKFTETLGGHSMGTMKVYQTQNFWDATMAWSIAKYHKANKGKKIFQVNGRFHSDEKLGTVAKLKKYDPKIKSITISCFPADDFINPDWSKYENLADYVILTDPKVKRSF